ncbi:MAG: hypothetical protein ACK5HS_00120 [Mycoplasmatales bacterium]
MFKRSLIFIFIFVFIITFFLCKYFLHNKNYNVSNEVNTNKTFELVSKEDLVINNEDPWPTEENLPNVKASYDDSNIDYDVVSNRDIDNLNKENITWLSSGEVFNYTNTYDAFMTRPILETDNFIIYDAYDEIDSFTSTDKNITIKLLVESKVDGLSLTNKDFFVKSNNKYFQVTNGAFTYPEMDLKKGEQQFIKLNIIYEEDVYKELEDVEGFYYIDGDKAYNITSPGIDYLIKASIKSEKCLDSNKPVHFEGGMMPESKPKSYVGPYILPDFNQVCSYGVDKDYYNF